jgi:hypothetical protein
VILSLTISGLVSAELEWQEGEYNLEYGSQDSSQVYTAKLVNLSDGDSLITPEDIDFYPDDFEVEDLMNYSSSTSDISGILNYSSSLGLWYANFPEYKNNLKFKYSDIINKEEILDFSTVEGDLSVDFYNLNENYESGKENIDIGANIDYNNSNDVNKARLRIFNRSNLIYSDNNPGLRGRYYFTDVDIPDNSGEFIVQISANGYQNIEDPESERELQNEPERAILNSQNGEVGVLLDENISLFDSKDLQSFKLNYTGHNNENGITDIDKVPGSDYYVSSGIDHTHIWKYSRSGEVNEPLVNYTGHEHPIQNVVAINNTYIASSSLENISIWDRTEADSKGKISSPLSSFTFNDDRIAFKEVEVIDGKLLAGLNSGAIYEIIPNSKKQKIHLDSNNNNLHKNEEPIENIEILEDNLVLSSGGEENHIWNFSDPSNTLLKFEEGASSNGFVTSLGNSLLATKNSGDDKIRVWKFEIEEGNMENVLNYTGDLSNINSLRGLNNQGLVSLLRGTKLEIFNVENYIERVGTSSFVEIRPDS